MAGARPAGGVVKRALVVLLCAGLAVWSACSREEPVSEPGSPARPAGPASAASTTACATDRFPTSRGELVLTPLGRASLLLGWDGKAIYVDPTSAMIADAALPRADVVLITEARSDHLDAVALERLGRPGVVVVGPPEVAGQVHVDVVLREGDSAPLLGAVATAVPLYSVARGPAAGLRYHDRGRGQGYVLELGGLRVYVSGDTECTPEVKALERIDVALVAVRDPIAMTPDEAAACLAAMRPRVALPYHDWRVDLAPLARALEGGGVELRVRDFYPQGDVLRTEAMAYCARGEWGICRDRLDAARTLDPQGEQEARVVGARARIRDWQRPFPAWW